jgi:PAS domain S-box-containing protein
VDHYETERVKKNGRRIHVALTVSPIKDSAGNITGASTIDRNITQQKRVADERDRFFTLSLDILCIINFDGFIKLVSPAWSRKLGYTVKELMTRSFIDLVHHDDRDATSAEFQKLRIGAASMSFENRLCHKDGTYRWFLWNAIAYFAEEVIYATARDITSMKKQAEEREKMVHELQEAVMNVKALKGLLPICATCRKVRDDQGYWEQLEAYIEKHSDAEFTHGLCPSCARDRYPDLFQAAEVPVVSLPKESHHKAKTTK